MSEDLCYTSVSTIKHLNTVHIFFYISFISLAVYLLVEFANYSDDFGSNSSNFEAMNIVVAPTNWKSALDRCG